MKEIMLADTPIEQRAQILRDSCDQIIERSYTRKFDQTEQNEKRAELSNVMIQIDDLEKDRKEGNYNPLIELSKQEDYEERCHDMLCMMIAESTAAFERLPCLEDVEILRNILYAGVWTKYNRMQQKKLEKNKETEKTQD